MSEKPAEPSSHHQDSFKLRKSSVGTVTANSAAQTKKTILEEHGYTILDQIGTGGYASVKTAYSNREKQIVAIKIISKYKVPTDYLKKFVPRELSVVKGIHHANIIRYYRCIETTQRIYIIMQYAENGSLLDLIRKQGILDEDTSRKICKQLLSALQYLHSIGIVHRDIKCENIMFDGNNQLKLIDFGFSRGGLAHENAFTDTYCGSYAYACPEILQGIPYEVHYADVWAAGVVLFSMIYGQLPFDDTNFSKLLKQVKSKIQFPKIRETISSECKTFIEKILAPFATRCQMDELMADSWLNAIEIYSNENNKSEPVIEIEQQDK